MLVLVSCYYKKKSQGLSDLSPVIQAILILHQEIFFVFYFTRDFVYNSYQTRLRLADVCFK